MTFLTCWLNIQFFLLIPPKYFLMDHQLDDRAFQQLRFYPPKTQFFKEKMLRLLEYFWGKNSSPIFSRLVRARASSLCILLVGTIKPYFYYQHFLLRPFLSEIFGGPFHRAKMIEQGETVFSSYVPSIRGFSSFFEFEVSKQIIP